MDKALEEIVSACLVDERIREIVESIASMDEKRRMEFKRKMNIYFAGRTSDEDVQAYRFYKIVLENAEEIIRGVKERERVKG
jgi:Tfp pilus assembly ATPase PilU